MSDLKIVDLTPETIGDYGVCGYKDVNKHKELRNKIEWYGKYYPEGLRIKIAFSETGGYQGMIEYIPGEFAHRPVEAAGYLFIHCLFVGFKKEYKGQGFATALLEEVISEAKTSNKKGVAVVTRKGSFMSDKELFIKHGFEIIESSKPDFKLLSLKFDSGSKDPEFRKDMDEQLVKYSDGLSILRSVQCPYTEKNVNAIVESAKDMGLKVTIVDLNSAEEAQNNPCPFGTFALIYNGKIISYHPISKTRFENIMKKEL